MKKKLCLLISAILALSLCACTPIDNKDASNASTSSTPKINNSYSFEYSTYGVSIDESVPLKIKGGFLGDNTISYVTETPSILSVDETGNVTGIGEGTGRITAVVKDKDNKELQTLTCNVEVNSGKYETLNGEETFVKWEGRNFTYENAVNCFNTASGFEVKFYGTEFKVTAVASGSGPTRLSVLIDKESDPRQNLVRVTTESEYVLAEGLEEGYHTIRVYKTSSATTSSLAFTAMETDGFFWAKPNEKELKIEVYGDSISVGAYNMRTTREDGEQDKDNGCYTYAWLAAEEVGADINVIARSGIGMVYSWGSEYFMSGAYKQTYCSERDSFGYQYNPDWDFSAYIPDVVIINIGGNDLHFPNGFWEDYYIPALTDMCNDLIDKYGDDVEFLLCHGMMTSAYKEAMEAVAKTIQNAKVLALPITEDEGASHPLASEHAEAAVVLAEALEEYL